MKKIFLLLAAITILFASCGSNYKNEQKGTANNLHNMTNAQTSTEDAQTITENIQANNEDEHIDSKEVKADIEEIPANTEGIRANEEDRPENTESIKSNEEDKPINTKDVQTSRKDLQASTENIGKGEEQMAEINYMTKEEFEEFISKRNINVAIEDFEGIDIDHFIHDQLIVKELFDVEDVSKFDFKASLERYMQKLEHKSLAIYMAKDILSINSTDEEYKNFKEAFLKKIDLTNQILSTDEYDIDNYNIYIEGKKHRILIGQTQNLEKCMLTKNNDGFYCVTYIWDTSGLQLSMPIFYSKNSKYFILANMHDDKEYQLIKTFCETAL